MGNLFGFVSGLLFGLGLILAGMTDPLKVKGFLDLAGAWDPSLGLVMGGAIALGVFVFARAAKRARSWTGAPMEIPSNRTIDGRLVLGGVLFGAGWGIGGFCPGPALVALGSGMGAAGVFVAAMLVGMVVHDTVLVRAKRSG
jgi:uncharacterized membrane protein YedE/YeeE